MLGEIDREFYCSADFCTSRGICELHGVLCCDVIPCPRKHRKWPTPEQFKEDYGEEYPDEGAVYFWDTRYGGLWEVGEYGEIINGDNWEFEVHRPGSIVCACTPWGKPPDDWRPE